MRITKKEIVNFLAGARKALLEDSYTCCYKEIPDTNLCLVAGLEDEKEDEITKVRTLLGSMKFTSEESTGKIKELSGGQKAKLLLIKLILDKSNVLILDEPTRNLSPLSNPVIRKLLREFKGTIISVSHDRKYINEVCDETYELTKEGLTLKN